MYRNINTSFSLSVEPELLTLLQEYEEGCAPDKFRTASTSATTAAAKYKAEETEWKQRQRAQDEAFGSVRESDRNKVIAQTLELFSGICSHCRKLEGRVLCHTCHTLLCPKCDSAFHFSHISHGRIILQEGVLHKLQSTQHIDLLGRVQNRGPIILKHNCIYRLTHSFNEFLQFRCSCTNISTKKLPKVP